MEKKVSFKSCERSSPEVKAFCNKHNQIKIVVRSQEFQWHLTSALTLSVSKIKEEANSAYQRISTLFESDRRREPIGSLNIEDITFLNPEHRLEEQSWTIAEQYSKSMNFCSKGIPGKKMKSGCQQRRHSVEISAQTKNDKDNILLSDSSLQQSCICLGEVSSRQRIICDGLKCQREKRWFHSKCMGLNMAKHNDYSKHQEKKLYCFDCSKVTSDQLKICSKDTKIKMSRDSANQPIQDQNQLTESEAEEFYRLSQEELEDVQKLKKAKIKYKASDIIDWLSMMHELKSSKYSYPISRQNPPQDAFMTIGPLNSQSFADEEYAKEIEARIFKEIKKKGYDSSGEEKQIEQLFDEVFKRSKYFMNQSHQSQAIESCHLCSFDLDSQLRFRNMRERSNHFESIHKFCQCQVCDQVFPTKKELYNHNRTTHKDGVVDRCKSCNKFFKSRSNAKDHRVNAENLNCRITCNFKGCIKSFSDDFKKLQHEQEVHPQHFSPKFTFSVTMQRSQDDYCRQKDKLKLIIKNEASRVEMGFPVEYGNQEFFHDDLVAMEFANIRVAFAQVRKVYENQKTFAIIKKLKSFAHSDYEEAKLLEYLMDWLTKQRTSKIYICQRDKASEFFIKMRFYKVIDSVELSSIQQLLKVEAGDQVWVRWNKNYLRDAPKLISYPLYLPETKLTQRLIEIREMLQTPYHKAYLDKITQLAFSSQNKVTKTQSVKSDQHETPDCIIKFAADNIGIAVKQFWDVNTFEPDWEDGQHYNALKEKFGGKINWCNPPFSAAIAHLMVGVQNWLEGRSTVFLVKQSTLNSKKVRAIVDLIAFQVQAGTIRFKGSKEAFMNGLQYVYMLTLEHLKYLTWYKAILKGHKKKSEAQKQLQERDKDELRKEIRDIALALRDQKAPASVVEAVTGIRKKLILTDIDKNLSQFQETRK